MLVETLEIEGVRYQLISHCEERKNITASLRPGKIIIKFPSSLNRDERARQLMKMKAWAIKKIRAAPEEFCLKAEKEYKDGEVLMVGKEAYQLKLIFKETASSSARIFPNNQIHLQISSRLSPEKQKKHISSLLSRLIARKRLPLLKERINELNAQHFDRTLNKIFFKNNKSNWGSCSELGNINISGRLLFAPDEVLEYVCLHELAHLIELNHSERFWALVEKVMPNYREKLQWLKENGEKCVF